METSCCRRRHDWRTTTTTTKQDALSLSLSLTCPPCSPLYCEIIHHRMPTSCYCPIYTLQPGVKFFVAGEFLVLVFLLRSSWRRRWSNQRLFNLHLILVSAAVTLAAVLLRFEFYSELEKRAAALFSISSLSRKKKQLIIPLSSPRLLILDDQHRNRTTTRRRAVQRNSCCRRHSALHVQRRIPPWKPGPGPGTEIESEKN